MISNENINCVSAETHSCSAVRYQSKPKEGEYMSQKTLQEVLKESKEGRKIVKKYGEKLASYEQSETDDNVINSDENKKIAKKISELMMKDPRVNHELKNRLPAAHGMKKDKLQKLRVTAKGDGGWKVKRAAQKELDKIREAREINVRSGYKSISKASYSAGRKGATGALGKMVFDMLLGDEEDRTQDVDVKDYASEIDYKYDLKNGQKGHLHGYIYEPEEDKRNGKVVLVYSGGGAPAAKYIDQIKETYLDSGCRVVVMDYRGFGKSKTEDANGKEIDFRLGESSMYEDGEAMLSYVQNTLGYKSSNIILHGYSAGGPVASKVAANMAERNAVKRKDGKLVKEKDRLGGLVLHSAIGTTYKVGASNFPSKIQGVIYGFAGWLMAGGFNTISHMKRLYKYDPKLRVHLVSGTNPQDHLDIESSGIKADNPYRTATSYRTHYSHLAKNVVKEDSGLQDLIKWNREEANLRKSKTSTAFHK